MSWRKIATLLEVPMSTVIDAYRSENPRVYVGFRMAQTRHLAAPKQAFGKHMVLNGAHKGGARIALDLGMTRHPLADG